MRYTFITTLTLSTSVSATVVKYQSLPRDAGACPFTLTAHGPGSASGIVGQLGDGQNRIGGGYPAATFYHQNGSIIDSSKRGCILTPRSEQWQCDQGVARECQPLSCSFLSLPSTLFLFIDNQLMCSLSTPWVLDRVRWHLISQR
jgi:hypothetical protein